jgi:hypothetical protein
LEVLSRHLYGGTEETAVIFINIRRGTKKDFNRSLACGPVVVHASNARCLLQGRRCQMTSWCHVVNFFVKPLAFSSIFVRCEKLERRAAVKFCFLLGKTAEKTVVMLETAYKGSALLKTQVFKWIPCFRNGELSLADQPRSGRSRTGENIARIGLG